MKNNKILLLLAAVIILLGIYAMWTNPMQSQESQVKNSAIISTTTTNTPQDTGTVTPAATTTYCTTDAKQCADGSWVGRTGPHCEFVCPSSTSTTPNKVTVNVKLHARVTPILESLTPLSVTEDSRCPKDVQCIQAGTVRVSVKLESGLGTSLHTFTLGQTVTTESEAITFVSVQPEKISTRNILPSEYVLTFVVSKR